MAGPRGDEMDESWRWHWVLITLALVAFVAGTLRLLLDESTTLLGTPTSCGNAVAWLAGDDKGRLGGSACSAQLHNASVEGVLALLIGFAVFVAWIVVLGGGQWIITVMLALIALGVGAALDELLAGLVVAIGLVGGYGTYRVRHVRAVHSR